MRRFVFKPATTILTVTAALVAITAARDVSACFIRSPLPVQVWLDHIDVDITDQVAVKTYNCTFRNPNPRAVVGGTCYMELEPGAQVDNMSVLIDGRKMEAEILNVDKANKVFQDIVRHGGSPALLEYYGNQLIQTKVPRIAPNGTVTVKLTYTTVLKKRGDLIRLQMLNTNPKALMQPLKSAGVTVRIKSRDPIKNVYSPTHKIRIEEQADWDVVVKWSQQQYMPKHPFVMYYQVSDDPIGASLIAHRESGEDGYFMMMVSPTIGQGVGRVTESQILPKDVVFCVDTSGSMLEAGKMEQARGALEYCVNALREGDRFNIVDFSTVARHLHEDGLVDLNDESKARALSYIEKLHARGGTAIQDALQLSLDFLDSDDSRLKMIVFATDGLPTIGERDPVAILRDMAKRNRQDVRIFVFGEGYDVNTRLLDFLAIDNRGEADYILPDESIAEKISRFFDRVGSPVMTDLEFQFDGMQVTDVYPQRIPDVYRGEQVAVFGRYNGKGKQTVRLIANINGERRTLKYELDFPDRTNDDRGSFVPRLWGGKKIDALLASLRRLQDENKKTGNKEYDSLVADVTRLAKRYGIVTPYTSYLMAEDRFAVAPVLRPGAATSGPTYYRGFGLGGGEEKLQLRLEAADSATLSRGAGEQRVKIAKDAAKFRRELSKAGLAEYDEQVEEALRQSGQKGSSLQALRYIGSRTFYKRGPEWQEAAFDPMQHKVAKTVQVGSDEYVKLLARDGRIAKFLALGEVVLQVDREWYRFEKKKAG